MIRWHRVNRAKRPARPSSVTSRSRWCLLLALGLVFAISPIGASASSGAGCTLDARSVTHTFNATHSSSRLDCNQRRDLNVSVAIQVSVDGGVNWDTQKIGSKFCENSFVCVKFLDGPCTFSGLYRNVATAIITGGGSVPNDVSTRTSISCP
jgi:hypothetical protein